MIKHKPKKYWIKYDKKADILKQKQQVAANSLQNSLAELKETIGDYKTIVATCNRNMRLDENRIREISSLAQEVKELTQALKEVKQ